MILVLLFIVDFVVCILLLTLRLRLLLFVPLRLIARTFVARYHSCYVCVYVVCLPAAVAPLRLPFTRLHFDCLPARYAFHVYVAALRTVGLQRAPLITLRVTRYVHTFG